MSPHPPAKPFIRVIPVILLAPLASLGPTLGLLWLLWDALLAPLGCPWAPLGPLGTPRGALGVPWGAFLEFDVYWTSLSEQMGSKYAACHQNVVSRNSSTSSTSSASSAEMVQTGPVRTYVLHAPGAKMTVVYTNSLTLHNKQSCKQGLPNPTQSR